MKKNVLAGVYTLLIILFVTIVPKYVGQLVTNKQDCNPCTWLAGFMVTLLGVFVLALIYILWKFIRYKIS